MSLPAMILLFVTYGLPLAVLGMAAWNTLSARRLQKDLEDRK